MFNTKKILVSFSVATMLLAGSVATFAAPYGNARIDEVRDKALNNYLTSEAVYSTSAGGGSLSEGEILDDSDSITYEEVTVIENVNYSTIKRSNPSLEAGETTTVREGVNGEKAVVYRNTYKNGKKISSEYVSSYYTKAPVSKIVEYGTDTATTPTTQASVVATTSSTGGRPDFSYSYYIDCEATAYDLSAEENGGYAGMSATGVPLDKGVIAVDPRVIPLGKRVYIEAIDGSWTYGYAVAADVGGAIKGNRVDLCHRTQKECIQFGRRPCRVYILD